MTTTDPTPLAEQIAQEHHLAMVADETGPVRLGCSCGLVCTGPERDAHIATVTEQAVREQMKAPGPSLEIHAWGATPEQADTIFTAAMDAAYDAAPEGVAVDAVGKLAGTAAPALTDERALSDAQN